MMLDTKKEKSVKNLFNEHMGLVNQTLTHMVESIKNYLNGQYDEARESSYQTHLSESEADRKRRQIIEQMYKGAFLPVVREDLINYLAKQDKIADRAESTCDFIITQRPKVPEEFSAYFSELAENVFQALEPLNRAVEYFFTDFTKIREPIKQVNTLEEEADTLEWNLTEKIFNSPHLDLAEKIHLNELVFHIGIISDVMEDAADMLDSIVVKKRI